MIFRPLPEFPGYAVSECGVVKRCAGLHRGKMRGEKILRIAPVTNMVGLINDDGKARRNVRMLAMSAWCDADSLPDYAKPRPSGPDFRPCKNFPGYAVSQCGIVKRVAGAFDGNRSNERVLKTDLASGTVVLQFEGANHRRAVHLLVSEVWFTDTPAVLPNGTIPRVRMNWEARGYCHERDYRVRQVNSAPA